VVTWLFDNVEPGQETTVEIKVPGELDPLQVKDLPTPNVIAKSIKSSSVTPTPAVVVAPTPGGFDWTLAAIGLGILVVGAAAYFATRRKDDAS